MAFERRLGGDLLIEALELEALLLDGEFEVLGDFVLVDDAPDTHADFVLALDPSGGDARLHLFQFLARGFQERVALVGPQLRELEIATGNQPLAGVVRMRELKE